MFNIQIHKHISSFVYKTVNALTALLHIIPSFVSDFPDCINSILKQKRRMNTNERNPSIYDDKFPTILFIILNSSTNEMNRMK